MRLALFLMLSLSSSLVWAAKPAAMLCNSKNDLVQIVNRNGETISAVEFWSPKPSASRSVEPTNFLLRAQLEILILNPWTGVFDTRRNQMNVRNLDFDVKANAVAVRPGASGCIQLYVGEEAEAVLKNSN